MGVIKKICLKFFLVLCVLVLFNFLYKFLLFNTDVHVYSPLYEKLINSMNNSDVLYFGESSNAAFGSTDTSSKKISEFIGAHFSSMKFSSVDTGAVHAGIYYKLIKKIPDGSKVKAIIVTMNLRSFNADWRYSKYEPALQQSLILVDNWPVLLNRFLLALNVWAKMSEKECNENVTKECNEPLQKFPFPVKYKTTHEWDWMFEDSLLRINKTDTNKINLGQYYIRAFAFNIDTLNNIRIKDFDKIVKLCKQKKIKIYFNLLAENVEKANSLVGKELADIIKYNRDLLVKRYSRDAVVIDNLEKVKSDDFIDQDWVTEHYYQAGRINIARNVAFALSKDFQQNFHDIYGEIMNQYQKHGNIDDFFKRMEFYKVQIKNDKAWFEMIKQKATEKKISIDTMIFIDCKWLVENKDKIVIDNLEEKIAKIEYYKKQIFADTAWFSSIKRKAESDKIPMDSAIFRDIIWLIKNEKF